MEVIVMSAREEVRRQMQDASVQYLLVQFVDINGSPKVKMVPVDHLDDVIDDGAGFAGAAVMGMGQGPDSHDMFARVDLDSYSEVPWAPGFARLASDLYVDGQPYPYCPRQNLKRVLGEARREGYVFKVGIEPEHFLVTRSADGSIKVFDPNSVDDLEKPCYDFKGISNVMDSMRSTLLILML
jgi:glutamine synthetase